MEEKVSEVQQEAPRPLQQQPFYGCSSMVTHVCVCVPFLSFLWARPSVRLSVYLPSHHMRDALHVSVDPRNDEMHFTVIRIVFVFTVSAEIRQIHTRM